MSQGDLGASAPATATGPGDGPKNRRKVLGWVGGVAILLLIGGIIWAATLTPQSDAANGPGQTAAPSSSTATPSATPDPTSTSTSTPGTEPTGAAGAPTAPAPSTSAGPSEQFPELPAVQPEQPGSADGISVDLAKFESVTGEVVGPGDVAAPAVRVTVDIKNTGDEALDLDLVVMNAYMGVNRDPAETYEKPGARPVSGSLAPGKTAQGVYVFRIPEDRRDDVLFVVDYHVGQPAITWRGQVPV